MKMKVDELGVMHRLKPGNAGLGTTDDQKQAPLGDTDGLRKERIKDCRGAVHPVFICVYLC
jgi:hypothetical protein